MADIRYIDTQEGFLYLASLEDVFSRRIVGWAMADNLETPLVERALPMALTQRQPQAGLLHHSEAGGDVPFEAVSTPATTISVCWPNAISQSA